jgi:alpha-tubulin suppressor-like RCC1 family protein
MYVSKVACNTIDDGNVYYLPTGWEATDHSITHAPIDEKIDQITTCEDTIVCLSGTNRLYSFGKNDFNEFQVNEVPTTGFQGKIKRIMCTKGKFNINGR